MQQHMLLQKVYVLRGLRERGSFSLSMTDFSGTQYDSLFFVFGFGLLSSPIGLCIQLFNIAPSQVGVGIMTAILDGSEDVILNGV